MSNLFFVILLAVGFGVWKVLDYFQLPNTFSILLLILTALSGVLWCYHRFCGAAKTSSSSGTCRTTFW
ncbi:leader peptidase (signal peptidase I) [Haemophilus influenzae]|uniref:Leader peptidase (Signal peptidase I) n=1 Tax=Haemophilus influenzae TaxID=727 RepID=A0A2X1RV69_HAEIF|nr:leader peptidase (signal peptidase I) [Haemophilus influenzae]